MPVVVLDAVRTPLAAVHGALAEVHPVALLARLLAAIEGRGTAPLGDRCEVVAGCVEQVGAQGGNVARGAVLAAGWPPGAGGTTIDRGPLSGPTALAHAVALVTAGLTPLAVAAAVDSPSLVPPGAAAMGRYPYGRPWEGALDRRPLLPPGRAVEKLAPARSRQDEWAARSVQRARAALADGTFAAELIALDELAVDEIPPSRSADAAELAALPPMFDDAGTITAGNAAPDADGAALVVVADAAFAAAHDLVPLATVAAVALRAGAPDDPVGPAADAARAVAGPAVAAEAVELAEPSAAVALALLDALGLDPATVNQGGGPLGLGDPTATSGLRAIVSLLQRPGWGAGGRLAVGAGLGHGSAILFAR
jgi:acetyl-CoA acetyltransferase